MKTATNLLAVLGVIALTMACARESRAEAAKAPPSEPTTIKAPTVAAKKKAPAPTVKRLFAEYESIRALLADDTGKGIAARAKRLETMALGVKKTATKSAKPHLAKVASAADKLAAVDETDLAALRLAFGELSRPLVALLGSDKKLAANYHTFECPMAEGYKRWIQPNTDLANPYMGQKMLACGTEVKKQD